ncbi:extracellular solute-binding protein [Paenibacillus sp. YN15]|uniref:extracellular solute-binding protein n=1 Tax=Paenibacillus sp. YN15 TaxID=1742774 RepID=UPI00215BDA38|nr:extracellular solute-binding protein [Paenibacillus sp. YN15]
MGMHKTWMGKMLLGTAAVALVAAGCSNGEKKAADSSPAAQESASPAARANITVSIYDRNNIPPEEGTWDKNRWVDWVNANGPVNVKYVPVPRSESLPKFNALFATASAPDLILEYDSRYRNGWFSQGLLMPLDNVVEKYSTTYKELMKQFPQLKKLGTKSDGKLYEIGRVSPLVANHRMYIRQDWLDKLQLKMPETTEELLEVAKAFATRDPDGNSKNDTFGINMNSGFINHMFGHGEVDWVVRDGKLVHEWEGLQASIDFQKQLFDAGVVDKDFLTDKNGEKAKQDFLSGKLGIYMYQAINEKDYDTFKKNSPNGVLAIAPMPKSKMGQFSPIIGSPIQMVGAINAGAKNPEAVMKYIDFMIDPQNAKVIKYGIEGTHWRVDSATGLPVTIDAEKNKKELYNDDLGMMASSLLLGKWAFTSSMPETNESQKALKQLALKADELYVNKERPIPTLKPEYLPALPEDLNLIIKNVETQISPNGSKGDVWLKAVVSGNSYTAEQAVKDGRDIWEKAGGKKVDEFYAKWYDENKDTAFMLKDLYEFGEQAQKLYENK